MSIAPDVLVHHFKTIFYTSSEPLSFVEPLQSFDFHSGDTPFSDAELVAALKLLNGNAAPGPDRIHSRVIKQVFTTPESRTPLLALMNTCFVSGKVPRSWGESEVFILYKGKGSREDPNNYRGINLINDFSRIFERLLEARLLSWMSAQNPQGPMQFGFRAGVGTTDAHLLLNTVARTLTRIHGIVGYGCFVDLQKAFPSVFRSKVIESLRLAGAPSNTVRALAASWSFNSCRLRINSFLSQPFMINRGVKEGGINSPSAFSVVYARALNLLDVHVLPGNLSEIDPSRVYFFAFADDLALFSGNLSKVEEVLGRLNSVLPDFGMNINIGKTCWMPFLPIDSRFRVDVPEPFALSLSGQFLDCVDEFKYLGYHVNSFLGSGTHINQKRDSMFTVARTMGRLLRSLQVTNLRSIRTYFYLFVTSQLYGFECFNFRIEDVYRAAKVFLQTIFCLPDSFPINMARSLLNLQVFEVTTLDCRFRFLQRSYLSVVNPFTAKALDYDNNVLRSTRSGFSHDLFSFLENFFDTTDLEDISLRDMESLQDLRDQIMVQRQEEFRVSFRSSTGLSFVSDLSPDAMMPRAFGEFLGDLEYEHARIVLVCLGDVFRFSLAATNSRCPFCPIDLHFRHLFDCPNAPFCDSVPRWQSFVQNFQNGRWREVVLMIFLCLQAWIRGSHFFHSRAQDRVSAFLSSG